MRFVTIVLLLISSLGAAALAQQDDTDDPILIGATVPITGPYAATGRLVADGLALIEEQVNADGGIAGRPLEIVIEDATSSNSGAVSAFLRLTQQREPVLMMVSSFSPQVSAVIPAVGEAAIPTLYGGGATALAERRNRWMFRIRPPDSIMVRAMADIVRTEIGAQRPGVIYVQNDYGQGAALETEALFEAQGIPVLLESYTFQDNDMSPQLQRLSARGADAIMIFGFTRGTALILAGKRRLGLPQPIVANASLPLPTTLALIPEADLPGIYAILDGDLAGPRAAEADAFARAYEERFGIALDRSFTMAYVDGVLLAKTAIEAVGTDPEALRGWFAELDGFTGLNATYRADADGELVSEGSVVRFSGDGKAYDFIRKTTEVPVAGSAVAPIATADAEPGGGAGTALAQSLVTGIATGCVYALLALGFVLVYQATGVVNFAAGQMVMLGAFVGATVIGSAALGPLLGWMLALPAMAVLGILFFWLVYRPLQGSPIVTIIVGTIAVGIIIQNVAQAVWGVVPISLASPFGTAQLSLAGVPVAAHTLATIGLTALVVFGLWALLYRTGLGTALRAVAQDPETAQLMGIDTARAYAVTWGLAGLLAGLAGLLLGPIWFVDSAMGDPLALKAFAATIIGGFGSVPGAVVGGIFVGLAEVLGATYISSTYKDALVFLAMIAVLILRPSGLFGEAGGDRG